MCKQVEKWRLGLKNGRDTEESLQGCKPKPAVKMRKEERKRKETLLNWLWGASLFGGFVNGSEPKGTYL